MNSQSVSGQFAPPSITFTRRLKKFFSTSIDYNPGTSQAKQFYAAVQNKFHFAIHGHTAAELIVERIDSDKTNMGLTSWKGQIITRKDAVIAKNYLTYYELKRLQLLAEQFLAFAELRAVEQHPMYMRDWARKLDECIRFNEKEVLTHAGKVSHVEMESKVRNELEAYRQRVIAGEALQEDEFNQMLEEEAAEFILNAPSEDTSKISKSMVDDESYIEALEKSSRPYPPKKSETS